MEKSATRRRDKRQLTTAGFRACNSGDFLAILAVFCQYWQFPLPLPKTRAQRDNICLTGTYLVPLEPRTLLTNS
jgi:hypothetical protein